MFLWHKDLTSTYFSCPVFPISPSVISKLHIKVSVTPKSPGLPLHVVGFLCLASFFHLVKRPFQLQSDVTPQAPWHLAGPSSELQTCEWMFLRAHPSPSCNHRSMPVSCRGLQWPLTGILASSLRLLLRISPCRLFRGLPKMLIGA